MDERIKSARLRRAALDQTYLTTTLANAAATDRKIEAVVRVSPHLATYTNPNPNLSPNPTTMMFC